MNLRGLLTSIGLASALATGCVVNVATQSEYQNCSPGQTCSGLSDCITTNADLGTGTFGYFCSATCTPGAAACPGIGAICVASAAGGAGVCHQPCVAGTCPVGQTCFMVGGTSVQVCVPGIASVVPPVTTRAYQACRPAGSTCSDGTQCIPALAQGPATPQGNTCTVTCPSGLASSCPSFVPGQVECVNLTGNPSMFQCVRLCNSTPDCAAYGTQCLQVTAGGGAQIRICAP